MRALVLILTVLSATSFAQASSNNMIGEYSAPSAIRFPDYTEADCKAEGGELTDDNACIIPSTNTISIVKNEKQQTVVRISVIFGAANIRDFAGVVVKTKRNSMTAVEAAVDDDNVVGKIQERGCRLKLSLKGTVLKLTLNDQCDGNLLRANGAKKN
jgi:hypothetical protein